MRFCVSGGDEYILNTYRCTLVPADEYRLKNIVALTQRVNSIIPHQL